MLPYQVQAIQSMIAVVKVTADELRQITLRRTEQRLRGIADRLEELVHDNLSPPAHPIALIAAERQRQLEAEGWTHEHDDAHRRAELAIAAARYSVEGTDATVYCPDPLTSSWIKASPDRIRNLVKAGALIVAEIERLHRAAAEDERLHLEYAEEQASEYRERRP